jgi:uncharacterized protein
MTLTLNRRRILTVLALVFAIAVAYILGTSRSSGTAYAAGPDAVTAASTSTGAADHITVSAVGTVTGTPDTIRTSFSVSVTSPTVSGAFNRANADMARVQKALRAHGVAAKDLQTSNVSLYSYQSRAKKGAPLVRHYVMSESLTATLRSIAKSSATIQAAVKAGGSAVNLDQVSLDLTDNSALLTAARKNAFDAAKAKATEYAGLASRTLGSVSSITETVNNPDQPIFEGAYASAAPSASSSIPIEAGSQSVDVTVTVVFALS